MSASMQVCAFDCVPSAEVENVTRVCLTPSQQTTSEATVSLLEHFNWKRGLLVTDHSTPQDITKVSLDTSQEKLE